MTIVQQPDALSLSGNLKLLKIRSSEAVTLSLATGGQTILEQRYEPNTDGDIVIDLRQVVADRLSYDLRDTGEVYEQASLAATFVATVGGSSITFRVVRGGVYKLQGSATNFLKGNFLTWQPTEKRVSYYTPEFLTYYATVAATVKLKAYFSDNGTVTSTTITLATLAAGKAYTIPVQYALVSGLLSNRLPAWYDVWVQNGSGTRLTYIQRYIADNARSREEDWVLWENSLGGLDTLRAYGPLALSYRHDHQEASLGDESVEYRVDTDRLYNKDTGKLSREEARWVLDFFPSTAKYIYLDNAIQGIVVTASNASGKPRTEPVSFSFTFKLADTACLLNHARAEVPASVLDIVVPDLGNFTVAPRLAEFPSLQLSGGILIPAQSPYSEQWGTMSLDALLRYVEENAELSPQGGGSGTVTGISIGGDIEYPDEFGIISLPGYPSVPTKLSQLVNDMDFVTESVLANYVTSSYLTTNYFSKSESDRRYVTVDFFNSLFEVYDDADRKIAVNTANPAVSSIKSLVGLWTEEYLSALGKNPSSGGAGGTGSVNSIKIAANVFRDPDEDGIIDMSSDIVSSADRTRWNAASTASHSHSNKSVLDGITAAKISSWDAVASIMGSDSDTVINKWNEVVTFLDTYTEADTLANLLSNKLDKQFFANIFTVYDSDGNAIVPNTYTQAADNLRILVGTWTDEYLSALGKNPSSGGSGGTGSVNSIKIAANVFRDPDEDGIIDMSSDIVSSADRTRWNAASTASHSHSNKSVLDGITAAKISSWDAVASIMGTDSDTVINKWNEVVAFLDDISEESTLDGLLSAKANSSVTISAGNGLTGGGNLQANRSLSILLQTNSGLVASSSGLKLDIINNLTTNNVYKALSAAQGKALNDRLAILEAMFTREGSGTSADPYVIKANYGLYTDDFLSALGKNPSGGGSGGTGSVNSIKVAANVFRDPDADGIIDLTADIVSSADRTRWNAASTNSHTHSNKSVLDGITAGKVSSWDAVASIMGTDSDTVINKWNEVVAFLDTYTEADTLANLLSNKADKSDVYSASTSRTKNYVLAAPSSQNGAASFRKLVSADIPDLSSSYATASRATTLEGYFTNGVAKTAAKLSTVSKTAWGKTFWTSDGVPQDVDGTLTISGGELMIWNTADTSATDRWDMRFAWSGEIFQMWAYEGAYHDLAIGNTASATATYKGLYYDASEKMWGIGTTTPAYTLDVQGGISAYGNLVLGRNNYSLQVTDTNSTKSSALHLNGSNELLVGYGTSGAGYNTFLYGNNIYFKYSTSRTTGLSLSSAGVVSIPSTGKLKIGSCTIEWDSTNNMLKFDTGIYSTGAVSALGANSSGGGSGTFDEEAMWEALGTTVSAKVIASSHIPNLAASKITSGTFDAARIPNLSWNKITSDKPTTLSGYGVLGDANSKYYALYGGINLSPSSSNAVDLNNLTDEGSYYCDTNVASGYVTNKPNNRDIAFRVWVSKPTGTTSGYVRQRFQYYDQVAVYERVDTNLNSVSWGNWYMVQDNLANYASASSLNNYLPLSGGQMTGNLTWKNSTALSGATSTSYVLCIDGFADGGTTHYITTANLSVGSATKATQDDDGNTITSTYLTAIGRSGDYLTQTKGGTASNVTYILERRGTYSYSIDTAGWYRVGRFSAKGSGGTSCIMMLSKTFANNGNAAYVFSITLSYTSGLSITQLAGDYYSTSLIDKIRVEYLNNNNDFYPAIDIHISTTTSAANTYYVTFIGGAHALSEYEKDPTLTGSTFEFDTTIGMKAATPSTHSTHVSASNSNGAVGICASTNRGLIDVTNNTWIVGTNGTNTWLSQGNVGIGTTSPSQKLDVEGNIIASGYVAVGTGGTNSYIASDAADNIYLKNSECTPLVCDGKVVRRGSASTNADVTLGSSDKPWGGLYSTTGNFSSTLSVTGASTLTGNITAGGHIYMNNGKSIYIKNSSSTNENIIGMNSSNQLLIGYGHRTTGQTILYGLSLALSTNGSTRVTITNAGNVGIANSSPSEKLHVTGNILASGEVTASSDERLKTIVGDGNLDLRYIANAPNILFKWNNGQDDKVHGGSLAQYFLHGAKHFVLGNDKDYYSLNYGALATSMAISIAKEVLKHDDEITRLKKEVVKQAEEIVDLKNQVRELKERRVA